jgi:hypothetical protein
MAIAMFSPLAHSATTTLGNLTYDTNTHIISSSSGTFYLGFDVLAGYTYQQTLAATEEGGMYQQFHIASQAEAFQFYYDLSGNNATTQPDNEGTNTYYSIINSFEDGVFGANSRSYVDAVYFLAEEGKEVGHISLESYLNKVLISDYYNSISVSDYYSAGGKESDEPISWLLVSDLSLSAVPIPATAFLFGPAFLGFMGFRRRAKLIG